MNSKTLRRYFAATLLALVGIWGLFIGGAEAKVGLLALILALVCGFGLWKNERRRARLLKEAEEQKARERQSQS